MLKIVRFFSQVKRQQIINSTYEQLVDRIARTYVTIIQKSEPQIIQKRVRSMSTIFTPGDWVLDVGSSVQYAWTDLALKLTQNDQNTNKVISNDILDLKKSRENNIFVKGDINQEPVQTNIALELQNRNLDTILVDYSPSFTGNINHDGRQIMQTVSNVLDISHNFLKKGGNLVCKVLESQAEPLLDETFQIYFNEKYKYVPSVVRKNSPVCFYVMKGFMISQSYSALNDLLNNYKGSADKKIKLVERYQGKYFWDPIKMVRKQIFHQILRLRSQGRPDKDIIKIFASDPYAKVQKTLKLLKQAEQASKDRNTVLESSIYNKLTQGQLFKNAQDFPTTQQQFYERVLQSMETVVKQNKQKKLQKKEKISRAPLKQNQTYMKSQNKSNQNESMQKQYLSGDLQGRYSDRLSKGEIDLEVQKIQTIHPQIKNMMNEFNQAEKETNQKTIQDILQKYKHKYEGLTAQSLRNVQEAVEESVRKMTSQDVEEDRRLEKAIYRQDLNEENEEKTQRYVNQRRSRRKKPLF